jgi:shikimate dehydrogenase
VLTAPAGRRCGVLGDPIAHSLSPVIHRAAYAALGLDWTYDAQLVSSGDLAGFLAGLDGSWRGLSLTMPLKREAMALVDRASERAVLTGAANTLLLGEGGIAGDNTDVPGVINALREKYDGPVDEAALVGGGATAASALVALAELGCRRFAVHVREAARAGETLAVAQRLPEPVEVRVVGLSERPEGDVLVSTIPAAAQTDLVGGWDEVPVLFDVVYDPPVTPLMRAAADRVLVTGLDLLVHQAALQVELFTELPAPIGVMRQAGEAALSERT